MEGIAETVNMHQIKEFFYCSHTTLNKWSIIPRGRDFIQLLKEPHNRLSREKAPNRARGIQDKEE
jgi:putative glutathione S-transferase